MVFLITFLFNIFIDVPLEGKTEEAREAEEGKGMELLSFIEILRFA